MNRQQRTAVQGKPEKVIRNELTAEQKREIQEAFSSFKDTGIQPNELKLAMRALGFDEKNPESKRIFEEINKFRGDSIDFEKFLDIMIEKPSNDPVVELGKAFNLLCGEGQDAITVESLKQVCQDLGEKITDQELQEMIDEADKDEDKKVGLDDFMNIMKKTNYNQLNFEQRWAIIFLT